MYYPKSQITTDLYTDGQEFQVVGTSIPYIGDYYKVSADNRDLNYNKYFSEGIDSKAILEEYNSFNTNRLSIQELKDLLGTVGYK